MSKDCIRVLNLLENPGLGGINSSLFTTINEFLRRQEVKVINAVLADKPQGWLFDKAQYLGVKIEQIPCYGPKDIGVLFRLRNIIRQKNIDLLHTNGYRGNIFVRTMMDMRLARLPTVITRHGMPVMSSLRIRLYAMLERRPTRLAIRVIAVDTASLNGLIGWGVPKEKLRLIPNAVPKFVPPTNEDLMKVREELKLQPGAKVVLYLGRIEKEKGVYELLEAQKMLTNAGKQVYTLFVGEGSARRRLECMANTNEMRVRFLGQQVEVGPFLALCDLISLPSYSEGLPYTLLEAMMAGKPIVATHVGGIPALVKNGQNGMLVPTRDSDSLAKAIGYLIDNADRASAMGREGQSIASKNFSPKKAVHSLIQVYREACSEWERRFRK